MDLSSRFTPLHEDRELFNELREEFLDESEPGSALELMLVEKIAILFWRERRLAITEAEDLERQFAAERDPFSESDIRNSPIAQQHLVGRYQGMLGRQIRETLRAFEGARERHLQLIEVMDAEGSTDDNC